MARTDRASRLVHANSAEIYRAFTNSDALLKWLPPRGMLGQFERFDARPGGGYRLRLTYRDSSSAPGKSSADSDVVEVRFVEMVPDRRIVQAVDFVADDPAFAGTMTMTWTLTDVPGGTEVSIVAKNVPEGIRQEDHDEGLSSSLENLAHYLE